MNLQMQINISREEKNVVCQMLTHKKNNLHKGGIKYQKYKLQDTLV